MAEVAERQQLVALLQDPAVQEEADPAGLEALPAEPGQMAPIPTAAAAAAAPAMQTMDHPVQVLLAAMAALQAAAMAVMVAPVAIRVPTGQLTAAAAAEPAMMRPILKVAVTEPMER